VSPTEPTLEPSTPDPAAPEDRTDRLDADGASTYRHVVTELGRLRSLLG